MPEDAGMLAGREPDGRCSRRDFENLIAEWNAGVYNGRRFEMLAAEEDGVVVGTVSIYQHEDYVVSLGPEVFEEYRRRGFGRAMMTLALERARAQGYRVAVAHVRADNAASLRLHRRLGFLQDHVFERDGRQLVYFIRLL